MDETDFIRLADDCLLTVAKWLEQFDPDEIDYSPGDGAVTIEFADDSRFILSRQPATRQVWLAAGAHGWHFDYDETRDLWVGEKDGHELYARLAEVLAEKLGHAVERAK
jgi:CyaY protein